MVKPAATWLGELTGHLVGESLVVARGAAPRLEGRHRLPLPAALADPAARVDDGLELLAREEPVEHGRARGLCVGHSAGHAGAQYLPSGSGHAQGVRDGARGLHGERRAAHHGGVELHGDDDHAALRGGEVGVEGEPAHHGAAVDEAGVVGARGVVEGELEALLAQEHLVLVDEVDGRGNHVEVLPGGVGDLLHGRGAVEQLDRGAALGGGPVVEAEEVGGRRLRVEVDEQGPKAPGGEDRRQVHGGRRLADAALVVGNGYRAHWSRPL